MIFIRFFIRFLIVCCIGFAGCSTFSNNIKKSEMSDSRNERERNLEIAELIGVADLKGKSYHYAFLGKLKEMEGELSDALEYYRKALEFDSDSAFINYKIGEMYLVNLDLEEAFKYVNRAIESDRESQSPRLRC